MNEIKISRTYTIKIKNQELNLTNDEIHDLYKEITNTLGLREPISSPFDDAIKKPYVPYNPYLNDYWTYPFQTWCSATKQQ